MIDAVQVIYNIFDQTPEANLFPLCQELNIGVLARVPLDEGGLTGDISETTTFQPGEFRASYFRGDRKRQVVEHVAALSAIYRGCRARSPKSPCASACRIPPSQPSSQECAVFPLSKAVAGLRTRAN